MRESIKMTLIMIVNTAIIIFLLWVSIDYLGDIVINSNKENCNALGMHLGAEKYEWIPSHGCWIDGKRYYP